MSIPTAKMPTQNPAYGSYPRQPWLFLLTSAWGMLIFWLAPHPPMIDLPEHAAQVALLRDLLLGQSPWGDLFRINLFTPYLLGYALALPLSFLMPSR